MNWLKLDNDRIAVWVFDFDGNVLPTNEVTVWYFRDRKTWKIIETTEVGCWKYLQDKERYWHIEEWDFSSTLISFREPADRYSHPDVASLCKWHNSFRDDVEKALELDKVSPSLYDFKDIFLVPGRIWTILTARWNSQDKIEKDWLKIINNSILTEEEWKEQAENIRKNFNLKERNDIKVIDWYFREIFFYLPINNPHVAKMWNLPVTGNNSWEMKWLAMNRYINESVTFQLERLYNKPILDILSKESRWLSIWFSDDWRTNIVEVFKANVSKLNEEGSLAEKYHKYIHYFTWDRNQYEELKEQLTQIAWKTIKLEFVEHDDKLEITFYNNK